MSGVGSDGYRLACTPAKGALVLNKSTRNKIAKYFSILYNLNSWSEIMPYLPHTIQQRCMFRVDGGDFIRGPEAMKREEQQL